ncbi:aspartate/glutamate racemase family protein [Mangrovibacterium lignilyticum]|uniref:aspartate/glutamate racemase family protein n=1 Tax=Mangrovibacterium lignilyticum TaxID=2668052 RepID=UPI0013D62B5D|nr:aspartate/glutamate racemase family protein [Mangrovibacterium lignilyticum]
MRTLGLIGGTGWVSTIEYYRLINEFTNERLGGLNAAQLIIYSVNYADIEKMYQRNDTFSIMATMKHIALKLQAAEVDGILLCANTLHRFAEDVQQALKIPLVHIGEATASEIKKADLNKVGLLGTKYTMELDFYQNKLAESGIETLTPDADDRAFIHQCISEELLKNQFLPDSKKRFLAIIDQLVSQGAQGIVLGCTEIPLLIKPEDVSIPVFNTTEIHAKAAVNFALD